MALSHLHTLTLGALVIRQLDGMYSLNDLHTAAGGAVRHQPTRFMRLDSTKALIAELDSPFLVNGENSDVVSCAFRIIKGSVNPGTYVCRELVIAYAAWISAAFHLKVIRVFLGESAPSQSSAFNPLDGAAMAAARDVALEYFDAFRQAVKDGKPGPRMGELPAQVLEGIIADALINQRALVSFDYRSGRMACTLVPGDASVVSLSNGDYEGMVQRVPMTRLPELADAVNQRVGVHLKAFANRIATA